MVLNVFFELSLCCTSAEHLLQTAIIFLILFFFWFRYIKQFYLQYKKHQLLVKGITQMQEQPMYLYIKRIILIMDYVMFLILNVSWLLESIWAGLYFAYFTSNDICSLHAVHSYIFSIHIFLSAVREAYRSSWVTHGINKIMGTTKNKSQIRWAGEYPWARHQTPNIITV